MPLMMLLIAALPRVVSCLWLFSSEASWHKLIHQKKKKKQSNPELQICFLGFSSRSTLPPVTSLHYLPCKRPHSIRLSFRGELFFFFFFGPQRKPNTETLPHFHLPSDRSPALRAPSGLTDLQRPPSWSDAHTNSRKKTSASTNIMSSLLTANCLWLKRGVRVSYLSFSGVPTWCAKKTLDPNWF